MRRAKDPAAGSVSTAKRNKIAGAATPVAVSDRSRMLRKLPRERRQVYQRIRNLREEIGAVDFDVVLALRNLRNA